MSKVDAMQAMREARYAARLAPTSTATASRPIPAARKKATAVGTSAPETDQGGETDRAVDTDQAVGSGPVADEEALCGHRSMNNRSCRRPAGHSEKNHRYN
ncbi:hypothetical protein SAMN04515671_3222 [Nakamurella panacisegetis]|uniref:Uncharacterized protein n=1 Tax=Nakamurella panacisegetis TaxID=1090615 RepID=A0A1H0QRF3_9ACTN|nr:hypothetical protein [Nakamurella panacisegetis]SDP19931.1 hypothetical protein SAMN04515671_3222 [Nakamurella panacisegetis]